MRQGYTKSAPIKSSSVVLGYTNFFQMPTLKLHQLGTKTALQLAKGEGPIVYPAVGLARLACLVVLLALIVVVVYRLQMCFFDFLLFVLPSFGSFSLRWFFWTPKERSPWHRTKEIV